MKRILIGAALALTLCGCNSMINCGSAASNGYGSADCGLHTTFLAARSHSARPFAAASGGPAFTKS